MGSGNEEDGVAEATTSGDTDLLGSLPERFQKYSPNNTHVKTYTAGEDQGRLAEMAKEFGLAKHRQPREQVRKRKPSRLYYAPVMNYLHDYTVEDARMRAAWTSHSEIQEDEVALEAQIYQRMAISWQEGLVTEKDAEEPLPADTHGAMGGNLTSAALGVIKGLVGPAILYLPHAFATSGYATALPILALTTVVFLFSSDCLFKSWALENKKEQSVKPILKHEEEPLQPKNRNTDYGSVPSSRTKVVMLTYPELAYRALGPTGESLVKLGIALMQSGVCLTYLIFVPQNLHSSFLLLFGLDWSARWWLIAMVLIQIPLSWIRDIRKLTPTNLLANTLILYGLLICLGYAVRQTVGGELVWYEDIYKSVTSLSPYRDHWYLFIGTSVLLFEGSITLLVPLQEAVHGEEARAKFPDVYTRVILCVISFEAFFGMVCWTGFGDSVRTVLTVSLPTGYLATSVQLAYCLAVICTFPLQNFPALQIACHSMTVAVKHRYPSLSSDNWIKTRVLTLLSTRNFQSALCVCLLAIVAVCTMDSLDKVVSLMGSMLGCPIALVFPPQIHNRLDPNITPWRTFLNNVVSGMGFIAMVVASIITILTWNNR